MKIFFIIAPTLHYLPNGGPYTVGPWRVAALGGTFAPSWYHSPVALLPGASTVVSLAVPAPEAPSAYYVRVNGDGSATVVPECDALNNDGLTTEARCPIVN